MMLEFQWVLVIVSHFGFADNEKVHAQQPEEVASNSNWNWGSGSYNVGDCIKRAKNDELVLWDALHEFAWNWNPPPSYGNNSRGPRGFWSNLLFFNWVKQHSWEQVVDIVWDAKVGWSHPVFSTPTKDEITNETRAVVVHVHSPDMCSVLEGDRSHVRTPYVLLGAFGDGMNFGVVIDAYISQCNLERPIMDTFFSSFVNDRRLVAWVTFGLKFRHHKLISLPIGPKVDMNKMFRRCYNLHEKKAYLECARDCMPRHLGKPAVVNKRTLLMAAFVEYGYRVDVMERAGKVFGIKNIGNTTASENRKLETKVSLQESKYSLSPIGAGDDCYRTFEAIYYGNIPIIETRALSRAYDGLPVFAVENYFIDLFSASKSKLQDAYPTLACTPRFRHFELLTTSGWMQRIRDVARTRIVSYYDPMLAVAPTSPKLKFSAATAQGPCVVHRTGGLYKSLAVGSACALAVAILLFCRLGWHFLRRATSSLC